jgi:hypothetical protein
MIDRGLIASWLEVACLAPSPHNNQPWAARVNSDGVSLWLDHQLVPSLGPDRLQFMALGAFIENMSYAAAARGYELLVDKVPTVPRRSAEIAVRFRSGAQAGDNATIMLGGAERRRTNRGPYEPVLPSRATMELRNISCEPGTGITLITDAAQRSATAMGRGKPACRLRR